MTPTQRSLKWLRDNGYIAAVVEKWIPQTRRRLDLFNFIDILAVRGDEVLGVQATSGSNVSARVRKSQEQPAYSTWLQSVHRRFEVHGWAKRGPRGKRKLYVLRRIDGRTGMEA